MTSSSSLWRQRASGRAELALLLDLARGKKTYEDVKAEAKRYAFEAPVLRNLIGAHTSRTIQGRLERLTGISKASLTYFGIRKKGATAEAPLQTKRHPFNLLTSTIKRRLQADPHYFEVTQDRDQPGTVASSFTNSPEYTCHELVQDCASRGEVVIPIGLYGDGIAVGVDVYQDSLYAIYIYFPHRGAADCRKPGSKHTFTVYRKSEATKETVDDIWNVLLWELQALALGREPKLGEQTKPLESQEPGDFLNGEYGRKHRFCLMQIKGDTAYLVEIFGVRQWNSKLFMCACCHAHRDGDLSWHNFSFLAPWWRTLRTQEQFKRDMETSIAHNFQRDRAPFGFESRLVKAPYFRWTMIKLDWMHVVDLGVLTYVLGEAWWALLLKLAPRVWGRRPSRAKSRALGLLALKARLHKYYTDHKIDTKIPLSRLTLRKIRVKKNPKLKAKAAQARRLLPFTLSLARELLQDPGVDRHCRESLESLSEIFRLNDQSEITEDGLMQWRRHAATFVYHHIAAGFRVYPKFHFFMHMPQQVRQSGVARSFWCYTEESKNRDVKRIWNICSKGHAIEQQILLHLLWDFKLQGLVEESS